jgi:hypothetical protein
MRLARAMSETGFGDSEAVRQWLEAGKSDPLPELRYRLGDDTED